MEIKDFCGSWMTWENCECESIGDVAGTINLGYNPLSDFHYCVEYRGCRYFKTYEAAKAYCKKRGWETRNPSLWGVIVYE